MSHKEGDTNYFIEEIVFINYWQKLSADQINSVIDDFPGKKEFIRFYLTYNGGAFTEGATLYANELYKVPEEYEEIEVNSFLHISLPDDGDVKPYTYSIEKERERRTGQSEKFDYFISNHIPFADNPGDNTFWINKNTGEIVYIDYGDTGYDSDEGIVVASSFADFCKRIKAFQW
jgi:hypothetical protein